MVINFRGSNGEIKPMPYGNHARGAKFIDGSHWLLKSWKPLSTKCVCKFWLLWKNGCDV
jgi:hypothetical protein